jgi:multidrug efflux pump
MSLSSPFIHRPVATTLLTIAVGLAGALAYFFLPVSPLPQVDYPSISIHAGLPGASPETMASAVATPLERQFGRIAGITEMTSTSSLGAVSITIVFDLNRDIDAAGRDVQAAINAAAGQLPANLPGKPSWHKINPADAPIMILSMTSDLYGKARMYDAASSILQQKLSQVPGVGEVDVSGSTLPAVRVDVNPTILNNLGLGLEDVRAALSSANANRPKGELADAARTISLATSDQLLKADQYRPLIIAYKNGAPVRVADVATVTDSVEDTRQMGLADGKPAVLLVIRRQPGANIIDTVDRIYAMMPQLQASIPPAMKLAVGLDRTTTIRASVRDVERTLLISIGLVILVVFIFLRSVRATLIPGVAVPISLIGTFAAMYLLDYSLDNLSLMAMTIATGFVVDDAIVVVENISRHLEQGMEPLAAALQGAKEIGFTVMSISISLVAVFIPILLMSGYIGRLFREFAVTLSIAIGISMLVSLTTTPMMCAVLLKPKREQKHGRLFRASEWFFDRILYGYEHSLGWVLRHRFLMILVTLSTIGLTVYLYLIVPTGLFPQQDTGRLSGSIRADQDTSFQAMTHLLNQFAGIVSKDPDVETVLAFTGGRGTSNTANMFATLKPIGPRKLSADQVLVRLRAKLAHIPGGTLIFNPVQDIRVGGRSSSAQYQFTLQGDDYNELAEWAPKMLAKLQTMQKQGIVDVDSDQQNRGLEASLNYDRATAARLGITSSAIDNVLYDAFGQRQVSTMYTPLNQYHVVMEADPKLDQNPGGLKSIYVQASNGSQVPLSAFTHYATDTTSLTVNHSGQFPSITLSFNLLPGISLSDAIPAIDDAEREMGVPADIHGNFAGTAQAYQEAEADQPILIAAAIISVYIVLGILYESLIHPITILSTLPSAGIGALLALLLTHTELTIIALIGIILLIGIVKKNAIMMIDFALEAERQEGKTPQQAIFQACLLRFRPITMTTMAALLGGLPLALGSGTGSEMRRPLGIAIVGGLIFSQALTLYTTPVVYVYLDRFRLWLHGPRPVHSPALPQQPLPA